MATFLGPLILVLVGAGGLLVVFGRHLPDLRGHLVLATRAGDRRAGPGSRTGVAVPVVHFVHGVRALLRGMGRMLVVSGRAIGQLLKRPPVTLRVPRIAMPFIFRRRGVSDSPPLPFRDMHALEQSHTSVLPEERAGTETTISSIDTDLHLPSDAAPGLVPEERDRDTVISGATETSMSLPSDILSSRAALMEAAAVRAERDEQPSVEMLSPVSRETLSTPVQSSRSVDLGRLPRNTSKRKSSVRTRRERVSSRPTVAVGIEEENRLAAAVKLLKDGQLARAEVILVDALAENPRDLDAYRLLGQLYLQRDDFVQAREVLEEAHRREPQQTALCGLLGRTYFGLGEYGKALQLYQRAHDADETNLEYLERLLLIASRMDRRPLVKVTADKILALEPNHAEAKKHLARVAAGG